MYYIQYNIDWIFDDKEELYKFMFSFFNISDSDDRTELFRKELNYILKEKKDNKPLVVYDELNLFSLRKISCTGDPSDKVG